jgi:hypothetical protein
MYLQIHNMTLWGIMPRFHHLIKFCPEFILPSSFIDPKLCEELPLFLIEFGDIERAFNELRCCDSKEQEREEKN